MALDVRLCLTLRPPNFSNENGNLVKSKGTSLYRFTILYGSVRFGSVRFGSVRFGMVRKR